MAISELSQPTEQGTMLFNLIDVLAQAEEYVCVWRDGELYVEPVAATVCIPAAVIAER